MKGSDNKTIPTAANVAAFIAAIPEATRRADAEALLALFERTTGAAAVLWGPSIIGFGSYHYRYDSGREGDSLRVGFSPRKGKHSLYAMGEWGDHGVEAAALLSRLGKHEAAKACLYIKRLSDIDLAALEQLIALKWKVMAERYPL